MSPGVLCNRRRIVLHTGVHFEAPALTPPTVDDAERLRQFHAICRRDLAILSGVEKSRVGRWLLNTALGGQLRQFADNMAIFNTELVTRGLAEAATALCARYGGKVVAE